MPGKPSFANNCLLARRLVERGVRFVQLYHTDWDHHGVPGQTLTRDLDQVCRDIDQPCAALIKDLKSRGLLEDTLVVWGGEFGRTPMGEIRETVGRNHHIDAMTMWMAGGGVKPGLTLGETDEFGFAPVADRVHIHDVQATILHLLGLEHTKLTFRFQGRDFRLTDVGGQSGRPSCWREPARDWIARPVAERLCRSDDDRSATWSGFGLTVSISGRYAASIVGSAWQAPARRLCSASGFEQCKRSRSIELSGLNEADRARVLPTMRRADLGLACDDDPLGPQGRPGGHRRATARSRWAPRS